MTTVTGPLNDDLMIPTIKARNDQTVQQNMDTLFETYRQWVADLTVVIAEKDAEVAALRAVAEAAERYLNEGTSNNLKGWNDLDMALVNLEAAGYLSEEARPYQNAECSQCGTRFDNRDYPDDWPNCPCCGQSAQEARP